MNDFGSTKLKIHGKGYSENQKAILITLNTYICPIDVLELRAALKAKFYRAFSHDVSGTLNTLDTLVKRKLVIQQLANPLTPVKYPFWFSLNRELLK